MRPVIMGLAVAVAAGIPSAGRAQVRASERGTVSQTVDGTVITVDYARPRIRGRDPLFGGVVHWGEVWTPGANWATTLETSRAVRLNGQPVPPGKYSLWMIPRAAGPWTVFLNTRVRRFHTQRPDTTDRVVGVAVEPQATAAPSEVLTWSFPQITATGATLQLQWGATIVPLRIAVEPSDPVARAGRDLSPYLGAYQVRFEPDSSQEPIQMEIELFEQNGVLRARMAAAWPGIDREFDLIPAEGGFMPRYYQDGQVYEEDRESLLVFLMDGDRARGFELRFQDAPYVAAERIR